MLLQATALLRQAHPQGSVTCELADDDGMHHVASYFVTQHGAHGPRDSLKKRKWHDDSAVSPQAVQALSATQQEVQLLQAAAAMPEAERQKAKESNAPPPELMRQLMSAASGLESQRQQIRENLLRPSHMMPTRSLAQQVSFLMVEALQ